MLLSIQCIWCVRFLSFEGVLRMKVWRYSIKAFGEISLPQAKKTSFESIFVMFENFVN